MTHLRLTLLASSLAVAGCSGPFHSRAHELQLYVVQSPQAVAGSAPQVAGPTLRIARPVPAAGLNTDRIALTRPGNRLNYYASGRWSAPVGDVVSDLEVAVFRNDPAWSAVADDRSVLTADYLLQTSVDRFTADYAPDGAPPTVRVDLHCLLIRRRDAALVGSFAVSQSQQAPANRMTEVVAAFSQVADRAVLAVAAQADGRLRSAISPAAP